MPVGPVRVGLAGALTTAPRPSHTRQRYTCRRAIHARNSSVRAPRRPRRRPPGPEIEKPTDGVIRLAATCICGSDLWRYRGIEDVDGPAPIGHEYAGIVEQVGSDVRTIKPGQFVVGSFFASGNTCEICRAGYQTFCIHREPAAPTGAQAQYARIALADGTLVAAPCGVPEVCLACELQ